MCRTSGGRTASRISRPITGQHLFSRVERRRFPLVRRQSRAADCYSNSVLTGSAVAVAALVVLAGRLSGHAQSGGDLRPSDAQDDSVVDQDPQLRLCFLLRGPRVLDPLKHLGRRQAGNPLRRAWRLRGSLLPLTLVYLPGFRLRSPLRPCHVVQHAGEVRQPELSRLLPGGLCAPAPGRTTALLLCDLDHIISARRVTGGP